MKKYFRGWSRFSPLILCAGLLAPGISAAAPVTYQFDGIFDNIFVVAGSGAFDGNPGVVVGGAVTFTFVFDDSVGPTASPSGGAATWLNLGAMTIEFGGITTTITPGAGASGTPSNNDTTISQLKGGNDEIVVC